MKLLLKTAAMAALFLTFPAAPVAHASLTVTPGLTVANRCGKNIILAVRYKNSRGTWTTSSFVGINARNTKDNVVSTNNSIIYYYAESMDSANKTRWSGDHKVTIDGTVYHMKRKELTLNTDQNRYRLNLTCQ